MQVLHWVESENLTEYVCLNEQEQQQQQKISGECLKWLSFKLI